jgi:hypothetical protein
MKMKAKQLFGALALSLLASSVMAAVSPEEAAKLGTSLTPIGAEKAGNAAGTIPEWTGGLAKDAAAVDANGFLGNPFAGEQPLYVITAQNMDQYKANLSEGQLAMLKRYPETYKIPVYKTHRSVGMPQDVYDRTKQSALNTKLVDGGNGLENYTASRVFAFPLATTGIEVIWNHLTRYLGGNVHRSMIQATPQVNGSYTLVRLEDEVAYPQDMTGMDPNASAMLFFKQRVTAPARLAGNVLLVHESLNQVKEPRKAWVYNAGQRRVRLAPQVAYDGPGTASDGLRTSDNFSMFSGAPDRYDWKLVGKREMYVPYNNYELASPKLKYDQIIKAGHINQDLTRYELHRVWEIEANLKAGERNIYAKRRFFIDEDTWTILVSEQYDGRGQLWRVGEAYQFQAFPRQSSANAAETLYDLIAGRYLVIGLNNEEKQNNQYGGKATAAEFTPAALRNAGVR